MGVQGTFKLSMLVNLTQNLSKICVHGKLSLPEVVPVVLEFVTPQLIITKREPDTLKP